MNQAKSKGLVQAESALEQKSRRKKKLKAKAAAKKGTHKAKAGAAAKRASEATEGGGVSSLSVFTTPTKVGKSRGSEFGSSKKSASARVSVSFDVTDKGEPVWKTVDPKKLASGEEEIDKRLNGKINVISLFIACVSTLGLML